MVNFDAMKVKNDCVAWIRDWFENNGPECKAVIGISGGKDSSIVAALCVEALGKDRVFGVLMPQGVQSDIQSSYDLVHHLNIKYIEINISEAVQAVLKGVRKFLITSNQTRINLPPRIRMATLYAVSQSVNGRVANTCNLSEDYIGYSTRWGDSVGDFSPLANLTSEEVIAIGEVCDLPYELTHKVPSDGLCGKTDEDNFGFTYAVLNKYIRTGICENEEIKSKIDAMHEKNLFKLMPIPAFNYNTFF
jgi:NAD+ synthase